MSNDKKNLFFKLKKTKLNSPKKKQIKKWDAKFLNNPINNKNNKNNILLQNLQIQKKINPTKQRKPRILGEE